MYSYQNVSRFRLTNTSIALLIMGIANATEPWDWFGGHTLPNSNYVTFSDTFKAKRDILGIYMDIFKDKILDIIVVL